MRNRARKTNLGYLQAPEDAMEDSEIMREWANKAFGAAIRAAAKKKSKNKT